MRDHQVITLGCIIADGCCGIIDDEHVLGINDLKLVRAAHVLLDADQGIIHALAERQVIFGTRHNHRHRGISLRVPV